MTHMERALALKEKSKAKLAKVGAVLTKNDKLICDAYNADYWFMHKELEAVGDDGNLVTKPDVFHAEERIIAWCAQSGVSTNNTILYVTLAPCFRCARLILGSGIKEVHYKDAWWDKEALKYLETNGVKVYHD